MLQFMRENQVRLGIRTATGVVDVERAAQQFSLDAPATMDDVLAQGGTGLSKLERLLEHEISALPESEIIYAPCVTRPGKIICVGLNYAEHAKESNLAVPTSPVLFSKFNNSLAAHQEAIPLPDDAVKIDYEAELVLVIGKQASRVTKEAALSHVFGYTIGNDLSARDLQFRTSQWLLGKSPDHFAPIGPCLVTADEIDPGSLDIGCTVNGVVRQASNTRHMIFDCATLISYISQYITLLPGDIIFTGTPDGVILGEPEERQQWLKAGDEVVITIEKLGSLVNVLK